MRAIRRAAIGATALIGLLGLPVLTSASPDIVAVSGGDSLASCTIGAQTGSTIYPGTNVEPRIAVDPTTIGTDHAHLVGVWQQDRWDDGGARGIAAATSFGGGKTWAESVIPFTQCSPGGLPFVRASDPWVSIGPDGTVYVSAIGIAKMNGILPLSAPVLTAVSRDGGRTWSDLQAIPGTAQPPSDKEAITADPTKPGVAYLIWSPSTFSETTDGGKTWSAPDRISLLGTTDNEIVVQRKPYRVSDFISSPLGTKARRKVCTSKHGKKHCRTVRVLRSHPAERIGYYVRTGAAWSTIHRIATASLSEPLNDVNGDARAGQQMVDAAADPSRSRLYAVWEDGRFSTDHSDAVALSSSRNSGNTWTKPVQVSPAGVQTLSPTVAVSSSGVVGVTYYTVSPEAPGAHTADCWLAVSSDGGRRFDPPQHLAGPFDLANAAQVDGAPFLGDYQGLAAGTDFYPFFAVPGADSATKSSSIMSAAVAPSSARTVSRLRHDGRRTAPFWRHP